MIVSDARLQPPDIPRGEHRDGDTDRGGQGGRSPDPAAQRRVGLPDLLLFLVGVVGHDLPQVVGQLDDDITSGNDVTAQAIIRSSAALRRSGQSYRSVPIVLYLGLKASPRHSLI